MTARGHLTMWFVGLAAVAAFLWYTEAHAALLDPGASEQAYLTADPINPERWGLATPAGRYAVTPVDCGLALIPVGYAAGPDVTIWPSAMLPPWLPVGIAGADQPSCVVRVEGRMDDTPCFTDWTGACSAEAENN